MGCRSGVVTLATRQHCLDVAFSVEVYKSFTPRKWLLSYTAFTVNVVVVGVLYGERTVNYKVFIFALLLKIIIASRLIRGLREKLGKT